VDPQPDLTHASVKLEVRFALKPCSIKALIDVCCKNDCSKVNSLGIANRNGESQIRRTTTILRHCSWP
jgi:hypothetical protein